MWPVFKRNIQLPGFSAYPDSSLSQLIQISGVLLYKILCNSIAGNNGFSQEMASCKLTNFMTILFPLVHSHYGKLQNFKHSSWNHHCQREVPRTHWLRIPWFKIIKITKYTWKRTFPSESNTKTQLRPLSATRIWPYPLSTATSIGS